MVLSLKHKVLAVNCLACFLGLGFLVGSLGAQGTVDAQSTVKVIVGGTLIDGTGRPPVKDAVVVIEGNKIKTVGQKGKLQYPAGAEIIKAEGKFILPGLIDTHVHLHTWGGEFFSHYGITTVYDYGNLEDWIYAFKDGVAKGKIPGPRVFVSGPLLNGVPNEGPGRLEGYNLGLRTPQEARQKVRELAARGVDGLKFYNTTPLEILRAASMEARKHKLPVSIHKCPADARELVEAGVTCLVHASGLGLATVKDPAKRERYLKETLPPMPDGSFPHYIWVADPSGEPFHLMEQENFAELVQFLVQRSIYINPTLVASWKCVHGRHKEFDAQVVELSKDPGAVAQVPQPIWPLWLDYSGCQQLIEKEISNLQKGYKNLQELLRSFAQAGGRILPGADSVHSGVPGLGLHQEMRLLVDVGLSSMQVIMGATRHSAEFLRQSEVLGTVEPGKLADLLIVRADPLADISNLQEIDLLLRDGQVVDTNLHRDYVNPLPRPEPASPLFPFIEVEAAPVIKSVSPAVVTEGSGLFTLTINGRNFRRTSTVQINGVSLPTQFINVEQLQAQVPADLVTKAGLRQIVVLTPTAVLAGITPPAHLVVKFK